MDFERFNKIRRALTAFSFRDLQVTLTVATWMGHIGLSFPDIVEYVSLAPVMEGANSIGYFYPFANPEHSKRVREYEKSMPKGVRKLFRKMRLDNLVNGPSARP